MKDNHHVVKNKTEQNPPKPYLLFFNLEVIGGFEISSKLTFIFIMFENCQSEFIFLTLQTGAVGFV